MNTPDRNNRNYKTGKLIGLLLLLCMHITQAQVVAVGNATELQLALTNAQAGQTIIIADGVYNSPSGNFTVPAGVSGTVYAPITLQGSPAAILTTNDSAHGYGLWLRGSEYWILKGFTTRYCKNGIIIDSSKYIIIDSVQAKKCGQSGIALRKWSSYCTVKNCFTDSLGLLIPGQGEGIYVGSAYSNWAANTGGAPDTCNYNQLLNNTFGSAIPAENIDIKEGTTGGLVKGNIFNGKGLSNQNGGDSWIDVKGNSWIIEDNTGADTYLDGFQTHIVYAGWGNHNIFRNNQLTVNAGGYGIRVVTANTNGTAYNNIICNNNIVSAAGLGFSNVATQQCSLEITESAGPISFATYDGHSIRIQYTTTGRGAAHLYNVQGQQLASVSLQTGWNIIPVNDIPAGIYYLKIMQAARGVISMRRIWIP
jgi:hypothetical protein